MNIDRDAVKQFLSQLSPLQMAQLAEELREQWCLPEMGTVTPEPRPPDRQPSAEVDVVVTDVGSSRVAVIRALRAERPDLDLRQARDLLRSIPAVVGPAYTRGSTEALESALREAGATLEVQDAP